MTNIFVLAATFPEPCDESFCNLHCKLLASLLQTAILSGYHASTVIYSCTGSNRFLNIKMHSFIFFVTELSSQRRSPGGEMPGTSRLNPSETPQHNLLTYDEERLFELIRGAPVVVSQFPAEAEPELHALLRKIGNSYVPCDESTYLAVKGNLLFGWVQFGKIVPFYHAPGITVVHDIFARSQRAMSLPTLRRMGVDRDAPPLMDSENIMAAIRDTVRQERLHPHPRVRRIEELLAEIATTLRNQNLNGSPTRDQPSHPKNARN